MSKEKIQMPTFSEQVERRTLIEHLNNNMQDHVEQSRLFAKMRKIAYDAYLKEGFTPEQSLELCKV